MTSHPEWGTRTKATEAATAFSAQIKNRYVLITGLTRNSLGEAAALAIAAQGPALLILASRTPANLDYVAREIASVRPSTAVATVQLDLLSQASVRRAAAAIRRLAPRLDVLVNNAGVMTRARRTSPEGIEAQFAINHVGPDLDEEGNAAIAGTAKDWKSPDEGASTVIVAAFDPALNEPSGSFLSDCQFYEPPPYATDPEIADRLWSLSEDLVKEKFDLPSKL
ncbi:putative short-chain dehydrogenase reductase sdr [Diplodia seriata]|uniref:Putative short-chain dehydrogenase reductase sdr n=1 Tax=Diplodia seriata TaxID=420778 RepID=A0A0G2F0E7_9PEZI|nr:putative short-chain dehydrogenase reductase sdr [Diplodia seriata]